MDEKMAEDNTKVEALLKEISKAIQNQSKMDMFLTGEAKQQSDTVNTSTDRMITAIVKKLDDLEKGNVALSKKQIKLLSDVFKKRGVGDSPSSSEDFIQLRNSLKLMINVSEKLHDVSGKQFKTQEDLEEALSGIEKDAAKVGMSLKDFGLSVKKTKTINQEEVFIVKGSIKAQKQLNTEVQEITAAFEEGTDAIEEYTDTHQKAKNILSKFGAAAKYVTKDFLKLAEEEQRYAQANQTADAGWIKGLEEMNITTLDYMKILKETRIESMAMASAGKDFKETLAESQGSLKGFTASSKEAAFVSKSFIKNMSNIGVSQENLGDAVMQQTDIYKEHYRQLGYSADEFAKLTEELINDQGMRSTLLSLQEKERKQYVLGIQQRMAEYQTMGYTIERAKELQKTFQALNSMNPKERMKQAAKTRAMMGAMGMGKEGAELFDLQTRYRTMGADEKVDADKRMTEIQGQAAGKFGEMSGSGSSLGQSMAMQMMADRTGFTQIAEKFETASGEGRKIDQEQLEAMKAQADKQNEIADITKELLKGKDFLDAMGGTAIGSLLSNMLGGLGSLVMTNAAGFATVAAATMFGGRGGGGGRGKSRGKKPSAMKRGAGALKKGGKGALGMGKAVAKGALKKIPGLGLLAGIGFGADRLFNDGDAVGAGLELLSGIFGATGIGAPVSGMIDAGLYARDQSRAEDGGASAESVIAAAAPSAAAATQKKPTSKSSGDRLANAMENINTYIRSTGESNMELASSVRKLGMSIDEQTRILKIPSGRTS